MEAFPKNRYSPEEFTNGLAGSKQIGTGTDARLAFPISNPEVDGMEIYFPSCDSEPPQELLDVAALACSKIDELDNLVQHSWESECTTKNANSKDYALYFAYIDIEQQTVGLEYCGTYVNTQWNAKFKLENGKLIPANF